MSKAPIRPLNSLVAASKRLIGETIKNRKGHSGESWQEDAWDLYDLVGEQRFLATTLAGRIGQARFFVGKVPENETDPVEAAEDEKVTAVLDAFGGNASARAQMMVRLGVNLFVAGDGWFLGRPKNPDVESEGITPFAGLDINDLEWRMLSTSEVTFAKNGKLKCRLDDKEEVFNPDDVFLIRVWRPHPRHWWHADSPTRSSLPVLRELVGLTMHVSAQVDSRLAGAGVLVMPQSAKDAIDSSAGVPEEGEDTDPFTEALIDAMTAPIKDRSNASAVVPLVITVPDEAADKIRHLTFSTPLDSEARELRDEAIRRLALGQDAPPEILLGTGGVNHWGAWLIREDTITTHIEPPLALICDAITTQYLWPILEELLDSEEEARQYCVWYDVDHLIMRPNRTTDAISLHSAGALSDEALRDAAGFGEADAPEEAAALDPAVSAALDMVRAAPSLAQNPGLEELVAQLRAILADSELPPVSEETTEDTAPSDGALPEENE